MCTRERRSKRRKEHVGRDCGIEMDPLPVDFHSPGSRIGGGREGGREAGRDRTGSCSFFLFFVMNEGQSKDEDF